MPNPREHPARNGARAPEATTLLRADHREVARLLAEHSRTPNAVKKKQLAAQICAALAVHAQIEEEIFYPALKEALADPEPVLEARVEHATLRSLIARIEGAEPDAEMYEANMNVLAEYVAHHVKEEQNDLFRKAKATDLDLRQLGAQLAERKAELLARRA